MQRKFIKIYGEKTEKLEISNEPNYIYVYYKMDEIEQTSIILKNESKPLEHYLDSFFKEYKVSVDMKKDVIKYLHDLQEGKSSDWTEFFNFLIKSFSLHIMIGITMALCIFFGFRLGDTFDARFTAYPLYTISGVLLGLTLGGLIAFLMIYKYMIHPNRLKQQEEIKPAKQAFNKRKPKTWQILDLSPEEVTKAVRTFSDHLPKGVYRSILVKDDHSIDFYQLTHLLGGIPSKNYYMSKETYEIYDESEKHIPAIVDKVQKAVDAYVRDQQKYPILQYDPLKRINYYLLTQEHYLEIPPEIELYLTNYDGLITHTKPKVRGRIN